jgi:hypothetical protein
MGSLKSTGTSKKGDPPMLKHDRTQHNMEDWWKKYNRENPVLVVGTQHGRSVTITNVKNRDEGLEWIRNHPHVRFEYVNVRIRQGNSVYYA